SLVGILVYVAFRFEIGYGVGAVVATIHDLFMTIGIFVLFGRQFSGAMVGAILLIVGYSINDTIVVFDRIREELTLNPNARLRDIINLSINRTLSRTLITSLTTLFTATMLLIFGTGAINDLALTLIIGIITGTFSSIFIASPVFYWWHKGDRRHVEASHDIVPKYDWSASSKATK
ncbi:MAG: protein translocase subunit SecF, partial [Verrucomicrobia bacterium]